MYVSIRIQGHLDQSWQEWLEGLVIVHEPDGTSWISGSLPDQSALYGVLGKIDRLNIMLLSLERRETIPEEGVRDHPESFVMISRRSSPVQTERARGSRSSLALTQLHTLKEKVMRKIVVSMYMTLDGVVQDPQNWSFQFGSEEQMTYKFNELFAADALLLGRLTYESFAAAWPHMTAQTGAYGERMNSLPKYVASTTLTQMEWNANLLGGDLKEEIGRLKEQEGADLLIFGSVELIGSLMKDNLIDEYRLMVFPIVVGSGKRLFAEGSEQKGLTLVETRAFSSGVVLLTYQSEKK